MPTPIFPGSPYQGRCWKGIASANVSEAEDPRVAPAPQPPPLPSPQRSSDISLLFSCQQLRFLRSILCKW